MASRSPITELLHEVAEGSSSAAPKLFEMIYKELRTMAARQLADESKSHTLRPTELVNEAYLRLFGREVLWQNRKHFFGAAAEAMRKVLIDHARKKNSKKRGGGHAQRVSFAQLSLAFLDRPDDLLALDEALSQLEEDDEVSASVIKMKFFTGLSNSEVADALGISLRSVERHWTFARAWLFREIFTS